MKIEKFIIKIWGKYSTTKKRMEICKHCSEYGCDEPDIHEKIFMQMAVDAHKSRALEVIDKRIKELNKSFKLARSAMDDRLVEGKIAGLTELKKELNL